MHIWEIWLKRIAAAGIASGANGIITGFTAVGIDPAHFNLQAGLRSTLEIGRVSALLSSIIGIAAYLKQSPLPQGQMQRYWEWRADGIYFLGTIQRHADSSAASEVVSRSDRRDKFCPHSPYRESDFPRGTPGSGMNTGTLLKAFHRLRR